jgi:LacI family transcriptional regulator
MRSKTKNAELRLSKAPTLVHVARLAGVGIGTASRVINNQGYVSASTAARVKVAIEQLGYRPNEVARNLKVRRSGNIGIVVPDLSDPFIATCVQAAQIVIRGSGKNSILTFSEGSPEIEAEEIDDLIRRQIDGILIIPAGGSATHLSSEALPNTPLISFDQPIPGRHADALLVRNKKGAGAGAQHLIDHGHRRIAAIGVNKHLHSIQRRIEGYREVMKHANLVPEICMFTPQADLIAAQVDEWLKRSTLPTAILSLNGLTSIFLLTALAKRGIRIPDQVALVGFDDLQLAELLAPPLTVVRQPAAQLGADAASLLLERVGKKADASTSKPVTLDTELVIRRSCGCHLS